LLVYCDGIGAFENGAAGGRCSMLVLFTMTGWPLVILNVGPGTLPL
jgi:hypothetical protein